MVGRFGDVYIRSHGSAHAKVHMRFMAWETICGRELASTEEIKRLDHIPTEDLCKRCFPVKAES